MLFAKLDKRGWKVTCGVVDCGAIFAQVMKRGVLGESAPRVVGSRTEVTSAYRSWAAALPPDERHISLGPGWKQRTDGVYEMSEHAKKRIKQGKAPRYRRAHGRGYAEESRIHASRQLKVYPVTVVCWKCGSKQVLDAERLHVSPGDPTGPAWERKDWVS